MLLLVVAIGFNIEGQNRGWFIEGVNGAYFEVLNVGGHFITSATIDFLAFFEVEDCNLLAVCIAEVVEEVIDGFVHWVVSFCFYAINIPN